MRSRVRHELKTWPEFFAATRRGHKKFELRRGDRPEGFQVGDELLLKEWDPAIYEAFLSDFIDPPSDMDIFEAVQAAYTGQEVLVRVDYILQAEAINATKYGISRPDSFLGAIPANILQHGFVVMSVSLLP